jgi:hypothetical protein
VWVCVCVCGCVCVCLGVCGYVWVGVGVWVKTAFTGQKSKQEETFQIWPNRNYGQNWNAHTKKKKKKTNKVYS